MITPRITERSRAVALAAVLVLAPVVVTAGVVGTSSAAIGVGVGASGLTRVGAPEAADAVVAPVSAVTTVPATTDSNSLSFSDSLIYYTDRSRTDLPGLALWRRIVSGSGTPILSKPTLMTLRAGESVYTSPTASIAFSAGRGVIGNPGYSNQWKLLDRGHVTGFVGHHSLVVPNISGPYTLISGRVYRLDGERLYTEPKGVAADDIFGSKVVYTRMNGTSRAEIWLVDVEKPKPVRLAALTCARAPLVSIWADTAAWLSCDQNSITVLNLTSKKTRLVPTGKDAATTVGQLVLGEGTLGWNGDGVTRVLDLTSATSIALVLPGEAASLALDDHRIARQVASPPSSLGIAATTQIEIDRLPFRGTHRPRLIGSLVLAGFTPNGDKHADAWAPQFDVSKPLIGATLRITALPSGRTVRTLRATGADGLDGSLRGLVWNGRSGTGKPPRAGTYRWRLTARAADGEGTLVATNSATTITGTVEIDTVR